MPRRVPPPDRDIALVDAAFTALKDYGLPVSRIRREKHISSRLIRRGSS